MKVLVVCHSDLIPPSRASKLNYDTKPWRTEFYVSRALQELGHVVTFCGISNSLGEIKKALNQFQPDIVFNLLEEFCGEGVLESFLVSYLESIGVPFTGCGSYGLIVSKNKIAAKSVLQSDNLLVPGNQNYPKILKLKDEDSSLGISEQSIVWSISEERKQARMIVNEFGDKFFAEQYIEGRELHAAVFETPKKVVVSPIWETTFGSIRGPAILSEKLKWDFKLRNRLGVKLHRANELSSKIENRIETVALNCFRSLGLTGYARVDVRLDLKNKVYVLDVNPNPDLAFGDEFAECASSAGYDYNSLIDVIIRSGLKRANKKTGRLIPLSKSIQIQV